MIIYKSVEEFVSKQEGLLKTEQSAEIEEKETLYLNKSPKELEKLGLCIRYLHIEQQMTGLYGRFLVVFSVSKSKVTTKALDQQTGSGNVKLKAHQLYPGDIVGAYGNKSSNQEAISTGTVLFVQENSTTVAFNEEFDTSVVPVYRLLKLTNDVTYRRIKKTLELLPRLPLSSPCHHLVTLMFPCSSATNDRLGCLNKQLSFFDNSLDLSQQEAVKFVLHTQNLISVIHGPPGTGKTTTVVEVIRQSVKQYNSKILVCAPSNIAVDNLVERLSKTDVKVVRLGHPARALNVVQKFTLDAVLLVQDSSDIIKSVRQDISAVARKFSKGRGKTETYAMRKEMKELKRELNERETKAIKEVLKNADVVLATTTSASGEGPLKNLPANYFDLVIIDEAAQATEASCWIPLLFTKRCILAGDHKQLPPTIISDQAAKDGLSTTLLERAVSGLGENAVCMLTVQYRMNLMIMNWPSLMLYDNKLTAAECVKSHLLCHLPNVQHTADTSTPLVLVDTAGCYFYELDHEEEQSKGNPNEVEIVKEHVEALLLAGVQAKDIGIITPYNLQVELLRQSIHPISSQVEISSVDGFQGREKEAILISMVRSNDNGEIGFLSEDRRINVAITRARRHLFVVCDTQTVSHHEFLASFCEYMNKNADVRYAKQSCSNMESGVTATEQFELSFEQQYKNVPSTLKEHKQSSLIPSFNEEKDLRKPLSCSENLFLENDSNENIKTTPDKVIDVQSEVCAVTTKKLLDEDAVMNIINEFIESTNREFSFPETLTGSERALVHEIAEKFLLEHQSLGKGLQRKITIKKRISAKSAEPVKPVQLTTLFCETCLSTVPKENYQLHQLRCQKSTNSQSNVTLSHNINDHNNAKQKCRESKPQKKEKKTLTPDVVAEDFDLLVDSFRQINSCCNFLKCKESIKLLGQHCRFCNRTFCFSHHQAEVHGCGAAAKLQARQDMHKVHSHLNNIKKNQLTNSLKKKVAEMEKLRTKKKNDEH